ncbi:probable RNA polymerase II nuclear localization protein SLC7A6OS isoform X1 [Folsomia candida]|uniref:Probable RNA polymerase II nuclear localization protein SLC7A6OS n=1 Tax=Folsomia candida TaxID=158441 RepID=A0A226F4M2_FOLCA|nr:probable RNA polymerase II nuclear localization protein SLC7A6OS isoform X1 [Folsomia candida]OXA64729.1 putative RNA polymerase II nuclear localization protein SLC7A6OS [Folsomia candida]
MAASTSSQKIPSGTVLDSMQNSSDIQFSTTKTVLRMKRRMEESPSKILVMSYKRCKQSNNLMLGADEIPTEEINRVFRLAGTVDNDEVDDDRSISKTIKDALEIVERTKALERFEKIKARETNRPYKQRKSFRHLEKAKEDVKQHAVDNRFRVISQRRGLPHAESIDVDGHKLIEGVDENDENEPTLLFNLLDLVADDENEPSSEKKPRSSTDVREIGSITVNGVPMVKNDNTTEASNILISSKSGFVFDLYVAKDVMTEDQFQNQFVSVRPADDDYEFDFDHDDESDQERPEDDEDSNEEDNWRNDYPDSDPDISQSYGYDQQDDIVGQFANFGLKGEELSSDDDGAFVYSSEYGCDDGLGGMYNRYKSRLMNSNLVDEVVSSASESDVD